MSNITPSMVFRTVVFGLLMLGYYIWTWSNNLRDLGGDSAVYLLTAQYYSPWHAHSSIAADFGSASSYPPLFPLLLGLANLGGNVAIAHVMTTTFLLVAFLCLFAWLRTLGHTPFTAGMSTLVFALLPGTYVQAISILSENLYLLCTLVALVATTRFEKDRNERWLWYAASGVALSMLTRSAGVTLYVAFLIYLFVRRASQQWRLGLVALLPFMLWETLHGLNQPGYVSSFLRNYTSGSQTRFLSQLHDQITSVGSGWIENFSSNQVGIPVSALIAALCLGGLVRRLYLKQIDGFYAVAYLLLICLWPFPAESKRLVFPIVPILLVQGVELITALPEVSMLKRRFKIAALLFFGSIILITLPTAVLTVTQFIQGGLAEGGYINVARAGILPDDRFVLGRKINIVENDLKKIPVKFKDGDCIYSIKPSIISYYTSVKSIVPPVSQVGAEEFKRMTAMSGCRFFYVMGFVSPTYSESLYPLDWLMPYKIRFDSLTTVRVGAEQRVFSALVERLN